MKRTRLFAVGILVIGFMLMAPGAGKAEWFVDVYGGWSFSQDEDVNVRGGGVSVTVEGDFDDSFILGGRVGHWFDALHYLGIAFDASYFQPDIGATDVQVVPLSGLVMLRVPLLKNNEYPHGRIQPYIGAGPSLFVSDLEIDFNDIGISGLELYSDRSADIGFDGRAGLAVQIHRNVALFGEYRYTNFNANYEDNLLGINFGVETDFITHHAMGGISFRF